MNDKIKKKQKHIYFLLLAVAVLVMAYVTYEIGSPLVRFANEPEKFREFVSANGILGKLFYVGIVFVQVVIAFIPGEPVEIAGGYAFGAVEGTLLCLIGAFLGSVTVFLLVRKWGLKLVGVFFDEKKIRELKFLKSSPKRDFIFLLIFTFPGTPKDLLCYFAGLTDISFAKWLIISSLCRIPSVVGSTISGNALGGKEYVTALVVFLVTVAVSTAGLLVYNYVCKIHQRNKG